MALTIEDKIAILMLHRDNLYQSKTFEEYKLAHVAYVDFLLDEMGANKQIQDAVKSFTEFGIKKDVK